MPDIFELYNKSITKQPETEAPFDQQSENIDTYQEEVNSFFPEDEKKDGHSLEGNYNGDPNQSKQDINEQMSTAQLGGISTKNTRDTFTDPNSWSPEYANRGFMEESANSIMRGIGNSFIKGTGDMLQVAGGLLNSDWIEGNFLTKGLQDAGEEFAAKFKSYLPEDLQTENLGWNSMMNPKFWSTHVAEMIPMLAEFILLSKGGGALAKGALKKAPKLLPGQVAKTALGKVVPGTGKGLAGTLGTDIGLSATGGLVAEAVGGGIAGNVFSGVLNAAELINTNKALTRIDENGNEVPLYSNEELQEMAAGTVKNTASYVLMDMLSWGLTYGGLGKAFKGLNPVAKGGKVWKAAEQSKIAGKMFAYDIAPIFKGLGRVGVKGFAEGMEEQVQESWEEWSKLKAEHKVTGEGDPDLLNLNNFYDFFQSKENKATRVVSFAVGALGGAGFNIKDAFNKKAEDSYKLYDRAKNLAEIVDKQGSSQELEWQQYHIRETLSDISADNKGELYDEFANYLVENGNITEDEKKTYDEMFQNFEEVKRKAKNLNVKGIQALLRNNAVETHASSKIEEFQNIAKENIDNINQNEALSQNEKDKQIRKEEDKYKGRLQALSLMLAEAKQNQANLIIGKKASPLTIDVIKDQYGNDMIIGGLSTKEYYELTKEGEQEHPGKIALKLSDLSNTAKDLYNNIVEKGSAIFKDAKDKFQKGKEKTDENTDNEERKNTFLEIEKKYPVSIEDNLDGSFSVQPNISIADSTAEEIEQAKNDAKQIEERINAKYGPKAVKKEAETETAEETEAKTEEKPKEETNPLQGLESISDEDFQKYEETGQVSNEILDMIADRVSSEEGLSKRESAINDTYKDDILDRIVKKNLGTPKKVNRDPHIIDNLSQKEINKIQDDTETVISRTEKGIEIKKADGKQAGKKLTDTVNQMLEEKYDEKVSLSEDGTLTEEENEFIKSEVKRTGKKKKTLEDIAKSEKRKARESFKADKEAIENAVDALPMDARKPNKIFSLRDLNINNFLSVRNFIKKVSKNKFIKEGDYVSQNELDNYLNSAALQNLQGPMNIDRMTAVNHQLKRMFPNTNDPVQVVVVKNLYDAIGSQGLGTTLLATIYIDEKAWNQDKIYMHEMSHIYYKLTQNEPETQELLKMAMADPDVVKRTKELYDDYTAYNLLTPNGKILMRKDQLRNNAFKAGLDMNQADTMINKMIKLGELEAVPLSEQKWLLEEMFVAQLEGPLSNKFDKVFKLKNETRRQNSTKKWWGLLRKKGDIIKQNDGVTQMLNKLFNTETPVGNPENFILDTFKAVTKGIQMDSVGMDARVEKKTEEYYKNVEKLQREMESQIDFVEEDKTPLQELIDEIENEQEEEEAAETGAMFYGNNFDKRIKSATRLLRRFGVSYNKVLRSKFLLENQGQKVNRKSLKLFNKLHFESEIFNLAKELQNSGEFAYHIKNSNIEEIQAFSRYLEKTKPNNYLQILNSMHFVFSNAKHIPGFRNTINDKGEHVQFNSLSQREQGDVESVLSRLKYAHENRDVSDDWKNFESTVNRINSDPIPSSKDIWAVVEMLAPRDFQFNEVRKFGKLTYRGVNVPIETAIVGVIKKNNLFNIKSTNLKGKITYKLKNENNKDEGYQVYYASARNLIEALAVTNRQFTPLSVVKNAEGNMEPLRITNNHLTKEVDNMVDFMTELKNKKLRKKAPKKYTKFYKTKDPVELTPIERKKEMFMERYAHESYVPLNDRPQNYKHNQYLENIFDQFMRNGVLPTVSQYHGIEDISNKKGSLYKNSTALEQGLEDFMTFLQTSVRPGMTGRNKSYLANMGTFADSPRKFFMNTNLILYNDVFTKDSLSKESPKKEIFLKDGAILSSIYKIHQAKGGQLTRDQFREKFKKELDETVDFIKRNSRQLMDKTIDFNRNQKMPLKNVHHYKTGKQLRPGAIFNKNGSIHYKGERLIKEYAINSIVSGYNISEVFSPGISEGQISKRFKLNSSPIMSVKNPNFKIEPIFFADELIDGNMAGTDSAMYILEEDAELFQRLGRGVFNLNHGFKFLNASIEKDNSNFKGKTAYLKGYTTIIDKNHRLYPLMKARKNKYEEWHKKTYGHNTSMDLNDGTPNHIVIAMPQSSDKSNFSPDKFTEEIEDENGNKVEVYTDLGNQFTEDALSERMKTDPESVMKYYDDLYYNKSGKFIGISGYNFGPQQLMDKQVDMANTPVQMINSIIVNAERNGQFELATEIQQLLSDQKRVNLNKILDQIKSEKPEDYKKLIMKGLNREDMDQVQRAMLEDGGSLAHPKINQIVINQLAKTIRRAGNKLLTDGTYAHQKPDSSWRASGAQAKPSLKGYITNADGSLTAAEGVLPAHMKDKVVARQSYTIYNKEELLYSQMNYKGIANETDPNKGTVTRTKLPLDKELELLRNMAVKQAKNVALKDSGTKLNYEKYLGEERDSKGRIIGYHAKGEQVIMSRVPGHGPSSTGVFEVVGFSDGEGNQVQVSAEFNKIIGSDNDGDALFIQTKSSKKDYVNWNKAFRKIKDYWLSKEMAQQVQTQMLFEKSTEEAIKEVGKVFPESKKEHLPFSPIQRMIDYNNTMVAKRNVGPVFNIHKIANILAASEVELIKNLKIGGVDYNQFKDFGIGESSRNQQSAILANIILDNAKYGYADKLGINEYNAPQAVLLTNLGVPLADIGKIFNSKAAKIWSDLNRNNSSLYHETLSKPEIKKEAYNQLKLAPIKNPSYIISLSNIANGGTNQGEVIELLSYLADMNAEIQKVSTLMGGHNKIHVNPLVLEQQLNDFNEVLSGNLEKKTLKFNDRFKSNPDLKNYEDVAKATLNHQKNLNPIYNNASIEVLKRIVAKIDKDLTADQIENISQDVLKFYTARLLSLNNKNKDYVKNLMSTDPDNIDSVFNKLKKYKKELDKNVEVDIDDKTQNWTSSDSSVLFGQALSLKLDGPIERTKFISANSSFVNESFNKIEREAAQIEFEQLPSDLRNDLILYDLIANGWSGPLSISPFFSKDTDSMINFAADLNIQSKLNKSSQISPQVLKELEKVIALRQAENRNNPYAKVYVNDINNLKEIIDVIYNPKKPPQNPHELKKRFDKGQSTYFLVKSKRNKYQQKLYEVKEFTDEQNSAIATERSKRNKNIRIQEIIRNNISEVPNILTKVYNKKGEVIRTESDIDLVAIPDNNLDKPFTVFESNKGPKALEYLTEAGINYEEVIAQIKRNAQETELGVDAREDFYIDEFTSQAPLSYDRYVMAMEFAPTVSENIRTQMWEKYQADKRLANEAIKKGVLNNLENKTDQELLEMYKTYGELDVYAYSGIITPVVKQLAKKLIQSQAELQRKNGVKGKETGDDISVMQAYMMSGSTIPSNHPASQGLARMLEREYKSFINEKKKYIQEMNKITDALYKEKLGYGGTSGLSLEGLRNFFKRLKDAVFKNRETIYNQLYGNLVIREEYLNDAGTLVMSYKFKPQAEIENGFANGTISKAEKDFYDYFRKTTEELKPKNLQKELKDYIPHTSMSKLEAFSSRGLLGLLSNSRHKDQAIYDVKMKYEGNLMNFKQIEDIYKYKAAQGFKNDINKISEYRKLRRKAEKLLKSGKNEDGSVILGEAPFVETALGFGAINRFANNRSIKATELPSMDLNKALGDYIHSSLFVNGNENFQGMEKLQGYIEGVLAWNHENNLPNMNKHIQKVWKDHFLRNKRQKSFAGEKVDRVVLGLTRLNLFYALGYQANMNTGGLYAVGNILAGKYHNIKDLGGKAWIRGELRYWGLDQGFKGGLDAVNKRRKRMHKIMKEINFMEINVYDEVSLENKGGLDKVFGDIALAPMIHSERWIQQVHMLGLLTDEQLDKFDEIGNYKPNAIPISNEDIVRLEDRVKSSHGRGYQPTDQRAAQLYSWGTMMLQFSRFIPTMVHDRFAKKDINIYGRENIGTMRAVGDMLRYVANDPKGFVAYRKSLSEEARQRLDSGLKGLAMASVIGFAGASSDTANSLFWDVNYYWNYPKLTGKMIPASIRSSENLVGRIF